MAWRMEEDQSRAGRLQRGNEQPSCGHGRHILPSCGGEELQEGEPCHGGMASVGYTQRLACVLLPNFDKRKWLTASHWEK